MNLRGVVPDWLLSITAAALLFVVMSGPGDRDRRVAVLDKARPAIISTVLAYLVLSAFTVIPYAIWQGRKSRPAPT